MVTQDTSPQRAFDVFFSYAHEDESLRNELAKHLSLLEREGIIKSWHDRRITAGSEWVNAIDDNFRTAHIILLLVSAYFLASDFCYEVEMTSAIKRHQSGEARVIPIILRAVDWQSAPFGKLQALPRNGHPITSWGNIDEAFHDVALGIRRVAEELAYASDPKVKHIATTSQQKGERSETMMIGLPASPEIFLGRDDDMTQLKERIGIIRGSRDSGPMQMLTAVRGWPGIGKTALATEFAKDGDVTTAFPDGVLWTSLGPSPNLIQAIASLGRALGTDDILRSPTLKEATQRLASLLRRKRLLMIVDDVWEVEHVIPFKQIRGQDCGLLVTTRLPRVANGIALPENAIYNLPALTEERSLELLSKLAPAVVASHHDACRQLVCDIECLPLALHVAGRLLQEESRLGWGVTDLLKALKEGETIIRAKTPADLIDLERETIPTVATLLRKSTDRLNEATRQYFAFLGPFASKPATFDLSALQAVWLIEDPKPIVRELYNRGLLEPVGNRFQLHALLVQHARALLQHMQ